jgi:PII-like signaling protein
MTLKLEGERSLMRIFMGEWDRCHARPHSGCPLHEAILLTLRDEGCAGPTVVRAIAGFGASAVLHPDSVLRLSLNLPIIIEVVEKEEKLREALPTLDDMIGGGSSLWRKRTLSSTDRTPARSSQPFVVHNA